MQMQEIIEVRKTAYSQTDWVRVDENSYMTNDAYDRHNYDDKRTGDRTKHNGYGIIGFDAGNRLHMVDVGAVKCLKLKRITIENTLRTQKKCLQVLLKIIIQIICPKGAAALRKPTNTLNTPKESYCGTPSGLKNMRLCFAA
jgi:hypothetical protein